MMTLAYHLPPLGMLRIPLRQESAELYLAMEEGGEIARLRDLDHLGIVREVWPGAHHSRWDYLILALALIDRCAQSDVKEIQLSAGVNLREHELSSGSELLKCWAMLTNIGHLDWTFTAERALLLEVWGSRSARLELAKLLGPDLENWGYQVLRQGRTYQLFQALTLIRLNSRWRDCPNRELWAEMCRSYIVAGDSGKLARLRLTFRNIRRLAYLHLDSLHTPAVMRFSAGEVWNDPQSLQRLLLHDLWGDEDALKGLDRHLYRDVYLSGPVLEECARREASLRDLIRQSLRQRGVPTTVEELASGAIQKRVTVDGSVCRVVTLPVLVNDPLSEYFVGRVNARTEQLNLERESRRHRASVAVQAWASPGGADLMVQLHAHEGDVVSQAAALSIAMARMAKWYSRVQRTDWLDDELAQDLVFERLAMELLEAYLRFFLEFEGAWEWATADPMPPVRAVVAPRAACRKLLRAATKGASRSRQDEVRAVRNVLGGDAQGPVVVNVANLIARRDGQQIAELDGLLADSQGEHVSLTLVEVKGQRQGGMKAAKRQLSERLAELRVRGHVATGPVETFSDAGVRWAVKKLVYERAAVAKTGDPMASAPNG